ncbi:protein-methionine-sulfoxide reductase catalytic subunit MsrP [Campylobacter geochelonis]|uniref:protein-methionine-sulfoxide reductase catalytic subunit MsrP n=1 Tax=Campylobacter geochelonis TaxID=1780362 RepID=UPI002413D18C|nr:protein-methionine-sulfoxide reductase catalytic subunit MsrP [Campylobacter geochelonis]
MMQEITDKRLYKRRRDFLKLGALASTACVQNLLASQPISQILNSPIKNPQNLDITDKSHATTYVNFYEFSTNKPEAVKLAKGFDATGWKVEVSGLCENPKTYMMEDFFNFEIEKRVYRMRCVEAWSMVIPWIGFGLNELINAAKPTPNAKFVKFTTLLDKSKFPDQNATFPVLKYPYVEGLRLDEAMHPLTLLAVGMYDELLSGQNGAPIRLVVPWKYGFKSIKSITKIEFVSDMPRTTWQEYNPSEYGFYANVNPNVSHPRWSQSSERVIGKLFKQETELYNGYSEVASLYEGMDLKKWF